LPICDPVGAVTVGDHASLKEKLKVTSRALQAVAASSKCSRLELARILRAEAVFSGG
jgi:hypothetical protein